MAPPLLTTLGSCDAHCGQGAHQVAAAAAAAAAGAATPTAARRIQSDSGLDRDEGVRTHGRGIASSKEQRSAPLKARW